MDTTMIEALFTTQATNAIPVRIVNSAFSHPNTFITNWIKERYKKEKPAPSDSWLVPNESGKLAGVVVGDNRDEPLFTLGNLYKALPAGNYLLKDDLDNTFELLLGYALGAYRYDRYKKSDDKAVRFLIDPAMKARLYRAISAHYLVRDLINEPPNSLTPDNFSAEIRAQFSGLPVKQTEIVGEALLKNNFPLIYTVGAGSKYNPRLVEITYGDFDNHPKLTLVGKGITFDTGGLDLKPSSGMRLMKKDMGGAAHAMALAKWLIENEAPLAIRLLIPIAENAVSDRSMRPSDIVKARNGLTVEIDNTDAEGRLVLADALAYATEKKYDALLNFATLTGSARVALGPEVPALFSNNDTLTQSLTKKSRELSDLMWPMPLHSPYRAWIESKTVDLVNSASVPQGGAITAALFLESFVDKTKPFAHIDVMAWNIRNRTGRPEGGEAMGLRAAYHGILDYFRHEV
ncbi:MAG: leucyl aminopeptidase family protein [Xanthomonadaceae bacterium]|nr:leucyl aminopeptidase family protein [Xanthomonadaceae bacterium]